MKDYMEKRVSYKCACGHKVTKVLYTDEEHVQVYFVVNKKGQKGVAIKRCPNCHKKLEA
jgi:hypothetical protein